MRSTPTRRVYVVGTDTSVGKTALVCALLRQARDHDATVVPFKPAQSGADQPTDIDRLLAAASRPPTDAPAACPLRFDPPLAPGLAEDPTPFLQPASASEPTNAPLHRVAEALDAWVTRHHPDVVLIEGAGGLHVPMPGGTWQPKWIRALADTTVVVGRLGLGTINHTLSTIDALRAIDMPPVGFYLCDPNGRPDPSQRDNPTVIAHARSLPHLGTLTHRAIVDTAPPEDLLGPLLHALGWPASR